MIKRKLVMACLFVLAVQLARVCLLADTKDQQMTLAEEIPDGTEVSVSGTVEWVREKEKITAVCLRKNQVRYAGTILKESKLVVCIRPDQLKEQLNIGDKVIAEGEKESFDAARNPGNFDQKEYYRKQGIHVKVRADTLEKQSEKSLLYDRIKNEMWKWRKKLSGQLQTKMGSYYGGTMSAILLGEKSGLDEEMRKLYQKNGMGHLLAISGLHMSLIGMGLYSFLRKAGTSFFTAGMAGSSFLLLYTGMTGNGIASQRAWIMFAMRMGAEITGREYDALTGLAAAAVWICIWFYRLKERRTEKEQRKTKSRERWMGVPGILLVCLSVLLPGSCWLMHQVQGQVTVTVLDVGQGDGICIRMPGGKNCLIDGGSSDVSSVGAYRIEPYLLYCGIRNIDYAFVSHGDEDHISGIRELLEDQRLGIGIRTLVLPAEEYWDEKLKELAVLAAENGTRIAEIHAGEQVVDGTGEQKMSLRCIGPEMGLSESGNAASMVLQAEYGNFSMLLTGDVEGAGEKQLVKSGRLGKCRILKAAHHGSKNSGTEEFLDAVEPQIVLISAGRGNRYGHPHEETLERLKSRNCQVYSTQQCGAVTIQSDGKKLFFSRKCGGGGSD
ncbi:MAG: ComEC/Rec2 family competence protein [[Ruminococcus] lactaris]